MTIRLNGEPRDIPEGSSIASLIEGLGLSGRRIAVERNRDIVSRERFPATALAAGDAIEIVQFVGGG